MERLGSLISLALSASLIVVFTYWYGGLQASTRASQPATAATLEGEQTTATAEQSPASKSGRKILYYRNPMGAPDTSPVPKKDPMGMDYIPVYADEATEPGHESRDRFLRLPKLDDRDRAQRERHLAVLSEAQEQLLRGGGSRFTNGTE